MGLRIVTKHSHPDPEPEPEPPVQMYGLSMWVGGATPWPHDVTDPDPEEG